MKKTNVADKFNYITLGELVAYAIDGLNAKIVPLQQKKDEIQTGYNSETDENRKEMYKKLIENCDAMLLPWIAKRKAAADLYKITTGDDYPAEF